jgi:hypothetical protein
MTTTTKENARTIAGRVRATVAILGLVAASLVGFAVFGGTSTPPAAPFYPPPVGRYANYYATHPSPPHSCYPPSCSGVGGSTPFNTSSHTLTTLPPDSGNQASYLAAAAPPTLALRTLGAESASWTTSTSDATAAAEASPAITALQRFSTTLTRDQWPTGAAGDVLIEIGDVARLTADLQSLSTFNMSDEPSWDSTFRREAAELKSAAGSVRYDLGLPPPPPPPPVQ